MIKKANAISNHKQSIRKLLPRLKWWLQSVLQTIFSRQEKKECQNQSRNSTIATYEVVNSETVPLPDQSFDLVTVM